MFRRRCSGGLLALIIGCLGAGACSLGVPPEDEYFTTPKEHSCAGLCGSDEPAPGKEPECWCDMQCWETDDCCADWFTLCSDGGASADGGASCKGQCGSSDPVNDICYCDPTCTETGDCCADYSAVCGSDAGVDADASSDGG